PSAMDLRLPEVAADAATVDAYVSGTRMVRLIPLVEGFVRLLERRARDRAGDSVLPDQAPYRTTARRVLVFDVWASGALARRRVTKEMAVAAVGAHDRRQNVPPPPGMHCAHIA